QAAGRALRGAARRTHCRHPRTQGGGASARENQCRTAGAADLRATSAHGRAATADAPWRRSPTPPAAVRAMIVSRPGGARRGRAETGDFQNLALVERLGLEERDGERDELVAVLGEQAGRFALALLDDAPHLGGDPLGGRLAVGLALEGGREPVVVRRHAADRAELPAHPPAPHHPATDLGDLPEVVLAARRDDAVDELLGPPPADR